MHSRMHSRKRRRQQEAEELGDGDGAASNGDSVEPSKRSCLQDSGVHFVRGERQYLFDEQGQKYLDTVNNVPHVGHCHSEVVATGASQMAELNTNSRFLNDRMLTYAQKLTSRLPEKLSLCYFVNSRSEANDLALQIADVASGHTQCISLSGCYHGHLQSLRALSGEASDGSCIAPMPDVYRGKYRDPETAGRQYAEEVRRIIAEQHVQNKTISAFIHETIMTHAGMIPLPQGFLQEVYRSVRDTGGVCIADEAECGLGRLGETFWGFESQGVCPDIVTLGEPMGNGHPIGAVVTTKDIADKFALGCSYFNTFGGNPVSMAIALSVLSVVEKEGLQETARQVGGFLLDQLKQLQDKHTCIGDIRGKGLCIGLELVADRESREPAPAIAEKISACLLENHHIVTGVDKIPGNVVKVMPPMCITMENARELVSAFAAVLTLISSHS